MIFLITCQKKKEYKQIIAEDTETNQIFESNSKKMLENICRCFNEPSNETFKSCIKNYIDGFNITLSENLEFNNDLYDRLHKDIFFNIEIVPNFTFDKYYVTTNEIHLILPIYLKYTDIESEKKIKETKYMVVSFPIIEYKNSTSYKIKKDFSVSESLANTLIGNIEPSFLKKTEDESKANKNINDKAFKYDEVIRFQNNEALVNLYGKWIFIDTDGNYLRPFMSKLGKYEKLRDNFHKNEIYWDEIYNQRHDFLNEDDIPNKLKKYERVTTYTEGYAAVTKNDKWGFIDIDENEIVPLKYDFVYKFGEGYAKVVEDEKRGFIDKNGKLVIPLEYSSAWNFTNGLAGVRNRRWFFKKYGFINKNNEVIVDFEYDLVSPFFEGMAWVQKGDLYGYVNTNGKEVVECKYHYADIFTEGFAQVCMDGKCGFIDSQGKIKIELKYEAARPFLNGFAPVKKNGKWGFVDIAGNEID